MRNHKLSITKFEEIVRQRGGGATISGRGQPRGSTTCTTIVSGRVTSPEGMVSAATSWSGGPRDKFTCSRGEHL